MGKEQNRVTQLGASSVAFLLLLAWLCAAFFASYVTPFESWKHQFSSNKTDRVTDKRDDSLGFLLSRLVRGESRIELKTTGFACHTDYNSEVCVANRPVRIANNGLKVYIQSSYSQINRTLKPYPTKSPLKLVKPVQIVNGDADLPDCEYIHDVPALLFSSGGFSGNQFHEFNELIIPLFITSRHFQSHLKFVIIDYKPWWVSKYSKFLSHLSRYEVINAAANRSVHCFPGVVIGLKYHGILALNNSDIPGGYSMSDFRQFLRESYNLKFKNVFEIKKKKPVLMFISRGHSRRIMNEDEIVVMMEEVGFQVVVAKSNRMSNLNKFTEVVNSCSVMVGAHGAGLATELFLPAGAVTLQVVPLGLNWVSRYYFGTPAKKMGVKYLEYKIAPEESSLIETYDRNHSVITNPESLFSKGYQLGRVVYIVGQNVKINVTRFRETVVQARELIRVPSPLEMRE